MIGSMLDLGEGRREAFVPLVGSWLARRGTGAEPGSVDVVEVEVLLAGRPGLLDLVARVGTKLAHLVVGLHPEEGDLRMLRGAEDTVLGQLIDDHGPARAVDALWDAELAPLVVVAIVGEEPGLVALTRDDDAAVVLDVDERSTLSVFPWLTDGPRPDVEMQVTLDEIGFNHLAAPIALWRRRGRDLGIVEETLTEAADGRALAMTSLRDLYATRVSPAEAGGDFAVEAHALGRMAARMHIASDKAFGRREGAPAEWVGTQSASLEGSPVARAPDAEARRAVRRGSGRTERLTTVRTHGDLHLGRTARTNQGWVITDWRPGGVDATGAPLFRSPLADVADLLWSVRHVALAALEERDLALRPGLSASARAWEARNRGALLSGYLGTPGIAELVPSDRTEVDELLALFEMARAASSPERPGG